MSFSWIDTLSTTIKEILTEDEKNIDNRVIS